MDFAARVWRLRFESGTALRYHMRRRSVIERAAKLAPVLSLVAGTAAFGTLMGGQDTRVALVASVLTTVVSAISLSFGLPDRARLHDALFRRWVDLHAEAESLADGDEAGLRDLERTRALIDADSPGQLDAASYVAEDAEREYRGLPPATPLQWHQRQFADWLTLPPLPWLRSSQP